MPSISRAAGTPYSSTDTMPRSLINAALSSSQLADSTTKPSITADRGTILLRAR